MQNQSDAYTTIGPSELWRVYDKIDGLFRGGGNSTSPQLMRATGLVPTTSR